jgi:hypothetical protein
MAKKPENEIEFYPDAMERFERAAGVVARSPPQHRVKEKPKVRKAAKKRKTTGKQKPA